MLKTNNKYLSILNLPFYPSQLKISSPEHVIGTKMHKQQTTYLKKQTLAFSHNKKCMEYIFTVNSHSRFPVFHKF